MHHFAQLIHCSPYFAIWLLAVALSAFEMGHETLYMHNVCHNLQVMMLHCHYRRRGLRRDGSWDSAVVSVAHSPVIITTVVCNLQLIWHVIYHLVAEYRRQLPGYLPLIVSNQIYYK